MKGRALSGAGAAGIIARLSVKRLLRGRVLWISLGLVILPAIAVAAFGQNSSSGMRWSDVFDLLIGLLAIVPPLYLASAVGEETEEKTYTYLWSRPFPRWSVLAGKLASLMPIAAVLLCIGVAAAFFAAFGSEAGDSVEYLTRGLVAMAVGTLTASAFCLAIGTSVPRQATAVALCYLIAIDTAVAVMPFSIRNLAIRYHVDELAIAGVTVDHLAWLAGMTALWLALAFWRVSGTEYASSAK